MTDLGPAAFDDSYRHLGASPAYDATVGVGLDLPAGLTATGLVSGPAFDEVLRALQLGAGDRLLDLGCGRGGYGLAAGQRTGADLVGVDFSAVAVRAARAAADAAGLAHRASFLVGDLAATGLAAGSVDAVMCLDAIQFARPTLVGVVECRRVLAPGGRVVFSCWQAGRAETGALPPRVRELDLGAALRDAGFLDVVVADRPDWLERERRRWEAVRALDPDDDPGLNALRAEALEVLPMIPQLRRLLVTARASG